MNAQTQRHHYQTTDQVGGDIMTRVGTYVSFEISAIEINRRF